MNSFTSIFSKILNTDSDAKYKEQLFLEHHLPLNISLKCVDLLLKLIVETFLYFKIRLDASLLDHLLHEAAALVKSMTYEYKIDILFKASSQSIKILVSVAHCIC